MNYKSFDDFVKVNIRGTNIIMYHSNHLQFCNCNDRFVSLNFRVCIIN
jgi:hypothetical protein